MMNCISCNLKLCAKFQNPRRTPSVRKVCDTEDLGVLAPNLHMLASPHSGRENLANIRKTNWG